MLTHLVSKFAIPCLQEAGYLGATFLMALESMVVPIPSEAVMPFVGFLVADGRWELWAAILAASAGSLIGSAISYAMGYYGGRPFVLKAGRYLLLNAHDLEMTERFFSRRQGALAIFISRFTPVVRHLISIPAGTGKMKTLPFLTATLLGAALWNSFLLLCGMYLRKRWDVVEQYSHQVDLGVGALLAVGLALFVVIRWKSAANAAKS
ncbi:MAG: DedA family protein [Syntrophobacteraceae bacterium]|nr:DedA family protein [Syntrophobacteraceae bacterium]